MATKKITGTRSEFRGQILNPEGVKVGDGTEVYEAEFEAMISGSAEVTEAVAIAGVSGSGRMSARRALAADKAFGTPYQYSADGGGGAADVTALEAQIAEQVAELPRLQRWARGSISVGSLIPGSDLVDPMPYIKRIFDAGLPEGKAFVFGRERAWAFQTRPSGAELGPQNQYLTPPRRCILEWQREWDFSEYGSASSPVFLRQQGSYGTAVSISGALTKGVSRTLNVTAGQGSQFVRNQRVLIRATAELTTLTGAFTLLDAEGTAFCARAEDGIVQSSTANTVTLFSPVRDDYADAANPVIQAYVDEPEIRLVNPMAIGPGNAVALDRFAQFALGRNLVIEGGQIENFGAYGMRVLSIMGGEINGLTGFLSDDTSSAGGFLAIGDATTDFLVKNVTTWGGSQPIMMTGSGAFYGITRDVKFVDCHAHGSTDGLTQHNLHELTTYERCIAEDIANTAFDIRSPKTTMRGCEVRRCGARAVFIRNSPNGLLIEGMIVDQSVGGIILDDSGDPAYDYDPDDITIRDNILKGIGGSALGGIVFEYSQLRDAAVPTLGKLTVTGNYVEITGTARPYNFGGKWTAPQIWDNKASGDGTGNAMVFDDAGNGASNGAQDINFQRHVYPQSMGDPSISNDAGRRVDLGHVMTGIYSTSQVTKESFTLTAAHLGMSFNNTGATVQAVYTLPGVIAGRRFFFYVTDSDGIQLQATSNDKFRIGDGAEGAANGTLTATNVGAWVEIIGTSSNSWNAHCNDPADWTVA